MRTDLLVCLPSQPHAPILYLGTVGNHSRHFNKLFKICREIIQLPEDCLDLTIDFHYCDFLAHSGVAFLGGLSHLIESRGGRVTFDWDTLRPNIYMNLAQNGFLHHFGCRSGPWDGNSIPYRSDSQHDATALGEYLRYKWLGRGWVNISSGLQEAIAGQTAEIYLNAFDHGQSEIGVFSCGQHYPKAGILHLTVIDFGIGISTNVRSLRENSAMSTQAALASALQSGTSTKQDGISRGLGLSLLQDFVAKNHGSLMIFSNDGYVEINDKTNMTTDSHQPMSALISRTTTTMTTDPPLAIKVWGDFACFTRPEFGAERVSYEVMTPSAARGILEAIFWKPEFTWRIREIHVLKPIQRFSILRNEINSWQSDRSAREWAKTGEGGYFADDDRAQRHTLCLRDVAYIVKADIELKPHANAQPAKYRDQFRHRVTRGQCHHQPYLGTREFSAFFAEPEPDDCPIDRSDELGLMLLDMEFTAASDAAIEYLTHDSIGAKVVRGRAQPQFFRARLEQGILRFRNHDFDEAKRVC